MQGLQRAVVGRVAKRIEQRPDLYTLLSLSLQQTEELVGYRVVTKVEVLQVYGVPGTPYGLEHIVKLGLSAHKERHRVVVRELDTLGPQLAYYKRVCRLPIRHCAERQGSE